MNMILTPQRYCTFSKESVQGSDSDSKAIDFDILVERLRDLKAG